MPKTLHSTYDELVLKARHYFWVKGYKSITNQELAEHLDVSTSLIYNKYTKDQLFVDSLNNYVTSLSDPVLQEIQNEKDGIESFRRFFYMLIDALLNKTFPKSCLMANTIVEIRNENEQVTAVYDKYFKNMKDSYLAVLNRAVELGEIKQREKLDDYAEFLLGVIFGLAIFYKIKTREQLQQHIDDQLSLLV